MSSFMRNGLLSVCVFASTASAAGHTANDPTQIAMPRFRVLRESSPGFKVTLRERFHIDQPSSPALILSNDTTHSVKAFTVLWRVTSPDGKVGEYPSIFISEPKFPTVMPGHLAIIGPGSYMLMSPTSRMESGDNSTAKNWQLQHHLSISDEFQSALSNAAKVDGRVDAVIFESGVVLGADKQGLAHAFNCEQMAAIKYSAAAVRRLDSGTSLRDVLSYHHKVILPENVTSTSDGTTCSEEVLERTRMRLRALAAYVGDDQAAPAIRRLATRVPLKLVRTSVSNRQP